MGLSGILLKRKDEIDPLKTIDDMKIAAINAGATFYVIGKNHYRENGQFKYVTANLSDKKEDIDKRKAFLIYVYGEDEGKYDTRYDFIRKNGLLNQAIHIEDFVSGEKFLFDFIYEYLQLNQNDIFWNEMDWFYNFQDIDAIYKQEFDSLWAYIKPDWK